MLQQATMTDFEIRTLREEEVEVAGNFARMNFQDSLAIFFNDEGVEQFHDSVTDVAICERMSQLSQFIACWSETSLVGLIELRKIRHIQLLLLERSLLNDETLKRLMTHMRQFVEGRERNRYLTINAAPSGYSQLRRLGFRVAQEEDIHDGGLSSYMKFAW